MGVTGSSSRRGSETADDTKAVLALAHSERWDEVLDAVDRGFSVNAREDWSLLLVATFQRRVPCVLALLARGADPNLPDKRGRTPTWCVRMPVLAQKHVNLLGVGIL